MLKRALAYIYYLYHRFITKNKFKSMMGLWFTKNGDKNYLTNHTLNQESLVFDVGGYTGVFSDNIIKKYNPKMLIFEPVKKYVETLNNKYANKKNIQILDFGLSNKDEEVSIKIDGDKSSLFIENGSTEKIILKDIAKFLEKNKIDKIDLISINIEGGEYPLLERLIESNNLDKFKTIQVQFHNFVDDYETKRKDLINKICKTHQKTFSFPFVWEGFELKK